MFILKNDPFLLFKTLLTDAEKSLSADTDLLDDVNAVVDLLSLQEGVEVVEQGAEVGLPVTVGYHYCCVVSGFTIWRPIAPTW